jgi:hypothetical protein
MKLAILFSASLLVLFVPPAFAGMPNLSVDAICKARSADARMLHSPPDQSTADCQRDETTQKQRLSAVWDSTSAPIRNRCRSDARALGITSYLELVTCIQMAEEEKQNAKKSAGKSP